MIAFLVSVSFLTLGTGSDIPVQNPPPPLLESYANSPTQNIPFQNISPILYPRNPGEETPEPSYQAGAKLPEQSYSEQNPPSTQPMSEARFVRTYSYPPVNPALSLTEEDPLAVLQIPPAELVKGEPHLIPDYPNHETIHFPVIPSLNIGAPNSNAGLYVYQRPDVANCIDRNCFCPMAYNPVCAFVSSPEGFPFPDRGYRVFSNSCSFKCAQTCDQQIQFAYCGECNSNNEGNQGSMECLKEVFDPPTTPLPKYTEPVSGRRPSYLPA